MQLSRLLSLRPIRYGVSVLTVLFLTILFEPFQQILSPTTVALAFLLVVLFSATFFGRNPALLSSLVAMLCFNYFFLPPVRTWQIAEPQNLIAWGAFTITAVIAGELSAYARRRAQEAESLYAELQSAFETASKAEALRQSEKLKTALLDAVTHDLQTPLTSIKASVTMLLDETSVDPIHVTLERESRRELLEVIDEETDRLSDFVESMVGVAKLEAGELDIQKSEARIEDILERALRRATHLLQGHKVNLNYDDNLSSVYVNSKAIGEAVYNLLDNAAKYSKPGTIIKINARQVDDSIIVSIEDEGPGIQEAEREKVFQKFYRGDKKTKGFGMGLAIVRGIIEANNGKIRVEKGEAGAKFIFELPVKKNE